MTRTRSLPAFVTATFAIALVLERPTLARQALMLAACLLTVVVRFQGLVLFAVLPTALLLKLAFDLLDREDRSRGSVVGGLFVLLWPTAAALGLVALLYAAYKHHQGVSLRSGLGGYEGVAGGNWPHRGAPLDPLPLRRVAAGGWLHPSVRPARAARARPSCGRRPSRPPSGSSLAVAGAATVSAVARSASSPRGRRCIEERNMFGVSALLILALVLWLAQAAPRPLVITVVAVVLPAALLLTLPLATLLNPSIFSDTFGLIPLLRLSERFSAASRPCSC